jgi:carbon starvation protein
MGTISNPTTAWNSRLLWTAVALLGAVAIGIVALSRGEAINAARLVIAAVCIYFIAYRYPTAARQLSKRKNRH